MGWCFTSLVTLWLPSWLFDFLWLFNFTWIFIFCTYPLELHFRIHFRIINYIIHKNDVEYDDSWHDMKLLTWTSWWHGNFKTLLLLHAMFLLGNSLLFTSIWLRGKESSVISCLELWSQNGVLFLSLDWSTCIISYKGVF